MPICLKFVAERERERHCRNCELAGLLAGAIWLIWGAMMSWWREYKILAPRGRSQNALLFVSIFLRWVRILDYGKQPNQVDCWQLVGDYLT